MGSAQFKHYTLNNGLQILLCQDRSLPLVTSMLSYRVGSAYEVPGFTGASHFLEHMLFKGSQKFGKGAIDRLTLGCGGENNAYTWLDSTSFYFSLPASHWELALEIEADRMQTALLDKQEIEAERQVILEEWQSAEDDPDDLFWQEVNALALQRHSYRYPVLGWPDDIRQLKREQLHTHYRLYYHPSRATLVLVGDLPDNALECIQAHLGNIPAGPEIGSHRIQESPPRGKRRLELKRSDVRLPRLLMAWPAPALSDPDYFPLLYAHFALSEGWSSRLHQKLVEEQQLATDVSTLIFETQDPYLFWLQVDLKADIDPHQVETLIFAELKTLSQIELSEPELQRIRTQLLTDYFLNQETTEDRAEFATEVMTGANFAFLQAYPERLQAVRRSEIRAVAQKYLQPDRCTLGWLLPAESENEAEADAPTGDEPEATDLPPSASVRSSSPLLEAEKRDSPLEPHLPEIAVQHQTLANGLQIHTHFNPRTPTLCLSYLLPAGSRWDRPEQAGLASLTLSALIKGTQHKSARAFSEALEQYGVSLGLSCGLLGVSLQAEMLAEHLEPVLTLLQEVLTEPAFARDEICKEQALMLAGLEQAAESQDWQASRAFLAEIYRGCPAAHPIDGTPESLANLQAEDVRVFYQRHYQPQAAWLTLAGALPENGLSDELLTRLGDWQGQAATPPEFDLQAQDQFKYQHIYVPEREQCTVLLGHLGVSRLDPDFLPLLVLDVILGNGPGFASRIPRLLRDEQGLAYHVNYSATVGCHLWPGTVQAQVECAPEKVLLCLQTLLAEIRRIQTEGVTLAELETAKAYLCGRFVFHFETNAQRVSYLQQQLLYQWPGDYLNRWVQQIQALNQADLLRVAQRHLHTQAYTLITAGPRLAWREEDFREL